MKQPFISVVIPAYNEEKYIVSTLEALKNQTYPQELYEVIVVDNGSTDKTSEIAQNNGAKVVLYSKISGVSAARQAGVEASQGEIIAFTDADSSVPESWLSSLEQVFQDQKIVAVGGGAVTLEKNFFVNTILKIYSQFLKINEFFGKTLPWGFNFAARSESLKEVGGFNLELKTSEDWDLALRMQKKFGKRSVVYRPGIKVATSTRKQQNSRIFIKYIILGIGNYISVVLLGKTRSSKMMVVR